MSLIRSGLEKSIQQEEDEKAAERGQTSMDNQKRLSYTRGWGIAWLFEWAAWKYFCARDQAQFEHYLYDSSNRNLINHLAGCWEVALKLLVQNPEICTKYLGDPEDIYYPNTNFQFDVIEKVFVNVQLSWNESFERKVRSQSTYFQGNVIARFVVSGEKNIAMIEVHAQTDPALDRMHIVKISLVDPSPYVRPGQNRNDTHALLWGGEADQKPLFSEPEEIVIFKATEPAGFISIEGMHQFVRHTNTQIGHFTHVKRHPSVEAHEARYPMQMSQTTTQSSPLPFAHTTTPSVDFEADRTESPSVQSANPESQ